jgi:hypothetical protein
LNTGRWSRHWRGKDSNSRDGRRDKTGETDAAMRRRRERERTRKRRREKRV